MKHKTNSTKAEERASVEAGVIVKLGMNVHLKQVTVVRQLGDLAPQPAQRFTKEGLLAWVKKMIESGAVVHSCYEAGVMGYTLHRELIALGANNVVVAPQKLAGAKRTRSRYANGWIANRGCLWLVGLRGLHFFGTEQELGGREGSLAK